MYMRPDLRDIFQERLAGHEIPVDPAAWQVIQAKIGSMAGAEGLQEVFQDKFNGHEVDVDPSVWNAISSQIGQGAIAGSAGGAIIGWAAAGLGALVVVTGIYFASTPAQEDLAQVTPAIERQVEQTPSIGPEIPAVIEEVAEEEAPVAEEETVAPIEKKVNEVKKDAVPVTITRPERKTSIVTGPSIPVGTATVATTTSSVRTNQFPIGEPEGKAVVENMIQEIEESVKRDALISGAPDPAGPPPPAEMPAETELVDPPATTDLPDLHLPNTFTPNGDGINDTYTVDMTGFTRMFIRVYSLQNDGLVFSTDTNEPWDGAHCEKGYYLVAIEALAEDGRLVTKGKAVWLNNDRY